MKLTSIILSTSLWVLPSLCVAQYVPANNIANNVLNTGVQITANYGNTCEAKSVAAQVYLISDTNIYQSQCLINSAWDQGPPPYPPFPPVPPIDTTRANQGFCHMRFPIDTLGSDRILLRLWRVTPDCQKYSFEMGDTGPGTYDDYFLTTLSWADYYYPKNMGSLITVAKQKYGFRMERNGGAIYEFYNLRATSGGSGFYTNAVHPHNGEALQVALRDPTPFMIDPCGGQDFQNPTQTGNACAHDGTNGTPYNTGAGPTPPYTRCDGSINNGCTDATTTVETGEHNMRNFVYAANYPGPMNPSDLVTLHQLVTANDDYAQVDLTIKNTSSGTVGNAQIEIPTFYFKPDYRKYTTRRSSTIYSKVIPDRTGQAYLSNADLGMDADGWVHEDLPWVTFENIRGPVGDAITIAWFYRPEFRDDVEATPAAYAYQVLETEYFRTIKFNNNPTFTFRPSTVYNYEFRYVIFPYRYNETINFQGTNMTVEAAIALMRSAYEGATTVGSAQ